jgi:hypothetical protein
MGGILNGFNGLVQISIGTCPEFESDATSLWKPSMAELYIMVERPWTRVVGGGR